MLWFQRVYLSVVWSKEKGTPGRALLSIGGRVDSRFKVLMGSCDRNRAEIGVPPSSMGVAVMVCLIENR